MEALRDGLAESDQKIRTAALKDGWAVVHHRGQVIREAMKCFYQQVVQEVPPRGAFAIHALGGTGRQEICPGSAMSTSEFLSKTSKRTSISFAMFRSN